MADTEHSGGTSKYITVSEARDILGVSKVKMAELIAKGALKTEDNPVDRRSKILLRDDVMAFAEKIPARKNAA